MSSVYAVVTTHDGVRRIKKGQYVTDNRGKPFVFIPGLGLTPGSEYYSTYEEAEKALFMEKLKGQ